MSMLPKALRCFVVALCVSSLLLSTGCASIVSGGPANIPISSNPSDAKVTVYDLRKDAVVVNGTTPYTAVLKRGAGYFKGARYKVVIEKTGYKAQEVVIEPTVNGWYIGNLLFGGLIGLLIVDPLTGSMYVLRPKSVAAELPKTTAQNGQDGRLMVQLQPLASLTDEIRERLEPVSVPSGEPALPGVIK